jgi:hypothetical protein
MSIFSYVIKHIIIKRIKFCINCFVRYLLHTTEKVKNIHIGIRILYQSFMEIYDKYKFTFYESLQAQ